MYFFLFLVFYLNDQKPCSLFIQYFNEIISINRRRQTKWNKKNYRQQRKKNYANTNTLFQNNIIKQRVKDEFAKLKPQAFSRSKTSSLSLSVCVCLGSVVDRFCSHAKMVSFQCETSKRKFIPNRQNIHTLLLSTKWSVCRSVGCVSFLVWTEHIVNMAIKTLRSSID